MEYRRLGQWGVKVSAVGLGGWLTHGRTLDDSTTERIVHRAFELGVNFFDTADAYHGGEAEKALAKAVASFRRDDLFLATKCFFPMSERPNDRGLSRKHVFESVHHSLRRLRTEYLDLMQFHRWDAETPLEETVGAIGDLVRQGKVLYWGVSMWTAGQIAEAVALARAMGVSPPVSNQPRYNMLDRGIERDVLPTCERLGLGQVVFSPLAQGVLTGKYRAGAEAPEGSRATDSNSNQFMAGDLAEENLRRVERLEGVAGRLGVTVGQLALAWCLRQKGVSSVIVGATRVEQIEENVVAGGLSFGDEVWEECESALA